MNKFLKSHKYAEIAVNFLIMEIIIWEIFLIIQCMDKESLNLKMGMFIKDIFKMVKLMEKETINFKMEKLLKAIMLTIFKLIILILIRIFKNFGNIF